MQPQGFSFSRRGLEGDDIPGVANALRSKERIEPVVCAEIEHCHPWLNETLGEGELGCLKIAFAERPPRVIVADQPPRPERHANRQWNLRECAQPKRAEGSDFFLSRLLHESPHTIQYAVGFDRLRCGHADRSTFDNTEKLVGIF